MLYLKTINFTMGLLKKQMRSSNSDGQTCRQAYGNFQHCYTLLDEMNASLQSTVMYDCIGCRSKTTPRVQTRGGSNTSTSVSFMSVKTGKKLRQTGTVGELSSTSCTTGGRPGRSLISRARISRLTSVLGTSSIRKPAITSPAPTA